MQRIAVVTLIVPLRKDYPWSITQKPVAEALGNAAATGVQWLDCVDGPVSVTVGETDVKEHKP